MDTSIIFRSQNILAREPCIYLSTCLCVFMAIASTYINGRQLSFGKQALMMELTPRNLKELLVKTKYCILLYVDVNSYVFYFSHDFQIRLMNCSSRLEKTHLDENKDYFFLLFEMANTVLHLCMFIYKQNWGRVETQITLYFKWYTLKIIGLIWLSITL